jgi:CBS domain-containing protein
LRNRPGGAEEVIVPASGCGTKPDWRRSNQQRAGYFIVAARARASFSAAKNRMAAAANFADSVFPARADPEQCHPQLDKEQAMQTIADVMTREVQSIAPSESIQRAAQLMDELNVGALPVCEGQKLIGIVTDRDITVRATSAGQMPEDATVETVMSTDVRVCHPQQTVDQVLDEMGDVQIRRVPVVDPDTRNLIGIVSLGDMATKHSAGIDHTLENISSPSRPDRGQAPGSGMQR